MSACSPECTLVYCPLYLKIFHFLSSFVYACRLNGFTRVFPAKPLCCRGDPGAELTVMSRLGDRNTSLSNEGAETIPKEIHPHWDICTCVSPGKSVSLWQSLNLNVCLRLCERACGCVFLLEDWKKEIWLSEMGFPFFFFFCTCCVLLPLPACVCVSDCKVDKAVRLEILSESEHSRTYGQLDWGSDNRQRKLFWG